MIVCLRTVEVPPEWRQRYLAWIADGRQIREQHGILTELVCEPTGGGETVVITVWPSHQVFDAWIATPHRDALTASEVHQAVRYAPITRYDVPGGYLNLPGLTIADPAPPTNADRGDALKWITRARPKTDRIACPWLIKRFIDRDAEIIYVPAETVIGRAKQIGGTSFDAPGADYTHQPNPDGGERCSFETLIAAYHLADDDPALARLAKIVHAADIATDLDSDPLGPGLLAIGLGGLDVEADDDTLLARGEFVYDALYAWCRQQVTAATG